MSKIAKSIAVLGVVAGLGVAALPLSSYAVESPAVTIQAKVDSNIAVSTNDVTLVDFGTVNSGSGVAVKPINVVVSGTVNTYNLGIIDKDGDNAMNWVKLDTDQTPSDGAITGDKIPAGAAALTAGTGLGWGFRTVDLATDIMGAWTDVPVSTATAAPIVSNGTLNRVASEGVTAIDGTKGITTEVEFGVVVDNTLQNGIYQDQVVFVATPGN